MGNLFAANIPTVLLVLVCSWIYTVNAALTCVLTMQLHLVTLKSLNYFYKSKVKIQLKVYELIVTASYC